MIVMNKRPFFLLYYHLLLLFLYFSSSAQLSDDRSLLISFRNSLPFPDHLPDWDPSNSPCHFSAVSCTNSRVSSIDLSSYNLTTDFSKVATFLLSLQFLQSLILTNTSLSGTFSPFSCPTSLTYLDLSHNAISGPVSALAFFSTCSALLSLNLSRNSIGPFLKQRKPPPPLRLPSLKLLDVSYNSISGESVASWILSGGEMSYLNLKGNYKLSGNLHDSIPFANLEFLDLSLNNFSSEFPAIDGCSKLRHLDISSNNFYGRLRNTFSSCRNLSFLNLTGNHFTGELPDMPRGGSIEFLYLGENNFSGLFPSNIADWCETLAEFDVSYNNLMGTVPETLAACSGLHLLDISHNNFSGGLPVDTLLELMSLKKLSLSFNNFVGVFPDSFSRLVDLEVLDLSSNNVSGVIPEGLCQGGKTSLKVLFLQNNMLGGTIPHSLSNCSRLESLDLSFNYLTGTIPYTLGSLSNLKDIILWLNQLHGEIPQQLKHLQSLEKLILDFNYLTGSIPDGLSNCSNLNWISLSSNQLSGGIPPSLGRLANLEILKLGNNSLSGRIPDELGDCLSLIWLDLNTNFFNGTIPPALFKQSGKIATALVMGQQYVDIKNDGSKQCHGVGNLLEFEGIRRDQLDRVSARYPCNLSRVYKGLIHPTFDHNGSMLFLDLSYNRLTGIMPKELGSMFYLFVLSLGHNDLSGPIPPELGSLRSLAILDLSYNRLNGTIPQTMNSLSFGDIDLSNNQLSGRIPEMAPFDTIPNYRFMNNSGLCGYPLQPCDSPFSQNNDRGKAARGQAYVALSVAVGLLVSLLCAFGLIFLAVETRKRRKKREAALDAYMENHSNSATAHSVWKLGTREALSITLTTFDRPLRKLTFADLLEATNGFHHSCLVGSGGFGDVYKAQLKDGSVVAIKKLIHISGQGDREFTAEMETIGRVKHRNLVPLLGYCKVGEERLLVYEYMKYGSLDDVLHDRQHLGIKLSWRARRRIAVGAARGLAFLHHSCKPNIIHRDMKSSNILLDENLEARVSDFGMARTMMNPMDTHLSVSTLAGTPGYVPPEYYQSFQCSTKGDVYSYGVVLLELVTGRQPTGSCEFGDNNLVGWVKQQQEAKMKTTSEVIDKRMMKEDPSIEKEVLEHLKVAYACLNEQPRRRPTMIQVLAMFKGIQAGSDVDPSSIGGFGIEMSINELRCMA